MSEVEVVTKKKSIGKQLLVIFLILLLLFNAFLIFKLVRKNNKVSKELVSTLELKEELDLELDSCKNQIVEYKDLLTDQDTLLLAKQKEIEELAEKIQVMIRAGKITQAKYDAAKNEIAQLKYYTKKYQQQIEELQQKNEKLTVENEGLKTEVTEVKREVDKLTDENVNLTNKVSLGEMLRTSTILVEGIQIKGGKQKVTERGNRMTALKVIFNIQENAIAKEGGRIFYVKVMNPKGETLYIEERGSGQFDYQGEQSLYTIKETLEYSNNPTSPYTIYWGKGSPFEKGAYKVQVYNEGVKIGEQSFTVK
ncbi:MAG: bZIP transcription factor [Bacteroidetes bacterium]|nr:bZIP transcription factor [Bacteroidota bacterium]MBT5530132.1 bZIP transcription factor [Cytophagia bacterium]